MLCVGILGGGLAIAAFPALAQTPAEVAAGREAAQGLFDQGKYREALTRAQEALALAERVHGAEHAETAEVLALLGLAHRRLNQLAEAAAAYRRALAIREAETPRDDQAIAILINNIAEVHRVGGELAEAETLHRRALALRERVLGADHSHTATSLNNLALVLWTRGRLAEAEALLRRALAIRERTFGPDHDLVASTLNNLALVLREAGAYPETAELMLRALAIRQQSLGPEHPDVALILNNLAVLYVFQGLAAEAEPLHRRALAIRAKAYGEAHALTAQSLGNIGYALYRLGRFDEAEDFLRRSLAAREQALGPNHPEVGFDLNNLAQVLRELGRAGEAEPLFRRALALRESLFGPGHHLVAETLQDLASLLRDQGKLAEAFDLQRRSLEARRGNLGAEHLEVAIGMAQLARLHRERGEMTQALALSREATRIYRGRLQGADTRHSASAAREQSYRRELYIGHLSALAALAPAADANARRALVAEAAEVAQLATVTDTGQAVTRMAARFAAGEEALSALVRERQDTLDAARSLETRLVESLSVPPARRRMEAEAALRDELTAARARLAALDAELRRRFPAYAELTDPRPLTLAEIQAQLSPGEAALMLQVGERETIVLAASPDDAALAAVALGRGELEREVSFLRGGLFAESLDASGKLPEYDAAAAHRLYARLLGPVETFLAPARHVMVVPDGALHSLPLAVLVTAPPPALSEWSDYARVAWLARRHALTTLPGIAALKGLRAVARPSAARLAFAGFGDPVLEGKPGAATTQLVASLLRGALADVEAVRQLSPLPDTAEELRGLARARGAAPEQLFLRERASERAIRALPLADYKVLAFATHALVAGEIKGLAEPALVLTPPASPSEEDDGLLTASEIARLRLDADWVILSACNTAAADGSAAGEGLSGLARAFFFAGSRALLVSHWPVVSEAAVRLTTETFAALEREPSLGRAEALRRAMLAMLDRPANPIHRHPMFWAPFVIAGEGGPGR